MFGPSSVESTDEHTPLLRPPDRGTERPRRVVRLSESEGRRERLPSTSGYTSASGDERREHGRDRTFSASEVELELEGCAGSACCHPQAFLHRVVALLMMCLLGFGSYFCFDNPGALQTDIKQSMNITTAQFANLYSWYSWPNVVLPVVGGFLMDRVLGIRFGTMLFAFIICVGQAVFSLGGFLDQLWVMEIGRFVFGIGGESLAVAQNTYAVSWFKGKELNMVFGFQLSVARVGSTVNFLLMGPLFEWVTEEVGEVGPAALGWTLLIAGMSCLMSFLCSIILAWMDGRRSKLLGLAVPADEGEVVQISDVKSFPVSFWFLSLACLAYYGAIFPFVSLAQDFFKVKFGFTTQQANKIIGLIYLVSAPASPLLGLVIDKTGRNISWVFLAVAISIGCYALLNFTSANPYIAIIILGVAYSLLASALWPIAALLIPEYQLGTAYGLMQAIQNLGTALITMGAGTIVDEYGYFWLMNFFLFWLVVTLASTVCIWISDCASSGYINMGVAAREEFDAERAAIETEVRRRRLTSYRLLQPRTTASIRNRYICKVGAGLPSHLGHGALPVAPRPFHRRDQPPRTRDTARN